MALDLDLDGLVEEHRAPGAQVAVLSAGRIEDAVEEFVERLAAAGHPVTGGEVVPVSRWAVSCCRSPSGSHLAMSARDLLEFVRAHLTDPALAALRDPQVERVPDFGGGVEG